MLKARANEAIIRQAMGIMEDAVSAAFLIALHNEFGFGKDRLNKVRLEAVKTLQWYVNNRGTHPEWRGKVGKTKQADSEIINFMRRDAKALGLANINLTDLTEEQIRELNELNEGV